jgi:hypothetical protein
VRDPCHEHNLLGVVDGVDDPVVADADAEVVAAGEPHDPVGTRLYGELVDRCTETLTNGTLKAAVRACRVRMETDLVQRTG